MHTFLKAGVMWHNTICEGRDRDNCMRMKNITTFVLSPKVVPNKVCSNLSNAYDQFDLWQLNAEFFKSEHEHEVEPNFLSNSDRESSGKTAYFRLRLKCNYGHTAWSNVSNPIQYSLILCWGHRWDNEVEAQLDIAIKLCRYSQTIAWAIPTVMLSFFVEHLSPWKLIVFQYPLRFYQLTVD